VDELVLKQDAEGKTVVEVAPLVDSEGKNVSISMGDGTNGKPLKCEWTTQKGGRLVVGSTGKERTDDDGNVVHEGEMWCKTLEPGPSWSLTHIDTRAAYSGLRAAALCAQGTGYMIHEAGRWSAEHSMWMFAPRKLSRQPYDEVRGAAAAAACPPLPHTHDANMLSHASAMPVRSRARSEGVQTQAWPD